MSSFQDSLRQFVVKTKQREQAVFLRIGDLCTESIIEGSGLTGSPGQPVDTGILKASWQYENDGTRALISTNVEYAPYIEDGGNSRGEFAFRSEVGGAHSVALTVAGFNLIVEAARSEVSE